MVSIMIPIREDKVAKAVKATGERWITIHPHGDAAQESDDEKGSKSAHGDYIRIKISGDGTIVGGSVPKSMHGQKIGEAFKKEDGHAHGKVSENPYHGLTHKELRTIHKDFKQAHEDAKRELKDMIHEAAKYLQEQHDIEHGLHHDLIDRIRDVGGIRPPQAGKHVHGTEYHESIPANVRRAIGHKGGMALDEVADELGMSSADLIDRLSSAATGGKTAIMQFYRDAEKEIDEMYGEDEVKNRKESIKHLEHELTLLTDAMKQAQEHEKVAKSVIAFPIHKSNTTDGERRRRLNAAREVDHSRRLLREGVEHEEVDRLAKSEKKSPCDRFKNEDGTFKGGFDGAVKYFMCQGHDKESATKIAGKIAAEKGEAGGDETKKSLVVVFPIKMRA